MGRASLARIATGASLAVVLLAGAAGCDIVGLVELPPSVVYPSIEPVADTSPVPNATFSWAFEGRTVSMEVPIDGAVLEGARRAPRTVLAFREITQTEWIPDYYRAFIEEPHQEPLYEALLANFRSLRETLGLNDDRYAELIVSFVQTLPYRTDPVDLEPKFPIQTIGDGDGDCDDKTLLAAALLAREGYDVAILLFTPEEHVALGMRSNGSTYGGSGYALVESTSPLLFGWVPDSLEGPSGDIVLTSEPMVVRIGDGDRAYGSGRQTDAIRTHLESAIARAEELSARIDRLDAALQSQKAEIDSLRSQMDRLSSANDVSGFNALVPRHNALTEEYNAAVAERNAVLDELNAAAKITERIADGQTDRAGLVRELRIAGT